jgi:hypothetical protein
MDSSRLSAKEQALIDAARRDVAAADGGTRNAVPDSPPTSPLDATTVVGWDHPAAQPAPKSDDKWTRVAALMEAERREAEEKRHKARRGLVVFLATLFLVVTIVGVYMLVR